MNNENRVGVSDDNGRDHMRSDRHDIHDELSCLWTRAFRIFLFIYFIINTIGYFTAFIDFTFHQDVISTGIAWLISSLIALLVVLILRADREVAEGRTGAATGRRTRNNDDENDIDIGNEDRGRGAAAVDRTNQQGGKKRCCYGPIDLCCAVNAHWFRSFMVSEFVSYHFINFLLFGFGIGIIAALAVAAYDDNLHAEVGSEVLTAIALAFGLKSTSTLRFVLKQLKIEDKIASQVSQPLQEPFYSPIGDF